MENVKIFLDNGTELNVSGLFYVFNSKYYFIYTTGELDENNYVKLFVVQVCKEVQNTPTGPIETGYMLGMEISNADEWAKVQQSITKIVEDKKNNTKNSEVQYLPMDMLVNLKIMSNNKFKLMKNIVEDNFGFNLSHLQHQNLNGNNIDANQAIENNIQTLNVQNTGEVIIDYRARFFEEQDKNQELEEQIKLLHEKLDNIKNIIG